MSLPLDNSPAAMAPPDGVCHFDNVPQEVLHMICDFAYGYPAAKGIITKARYDSDHGELVKTGKLTSFPPFRHHVDQYLVSKRFFCSAIEAFVKEQPLDLTKSRAVGEGHVFTNSGAFRLFSRSVKIICDVAYQLANFSSLRKVEVAIYDCSFDRTTCTPKYPWLQVLKDDDFASVRFVQQLSILRGLDTIACQQHQTYKCRYADTEAKRQLWEDNIKALQKYLVPIVTAPKSTPAPAKFTSDTEPGPLYPGSRVRGIGCKSGLISAGSMIFESPRVVFDTAMVTRVMRLDTDQLSRWVGRALRQHPELFSLLDDAGSGVKR
ncbi:hypothetical protein BST61_g9652 [Cercospora zeina]